MNIEITDHVTIPGFASSPVAEPAQFLIEAARSLGDSQSAAIMRAWCVPHIFARREAIFDSNEDPIPAFRTLLRDTARMLHMMSESRMSNIGASAEEMAASDQTDSVEAKTGQHYGNLFRQFSPASYWDETANLLSVRLERNGIDLASLAGKSVIDVGCGGGRYTGAWRRIGARPALGVDISPINIADARRRAQEGGVEDLSFEEADVLSLPQRNDQFDIVFSNGVLHHTRDWELGISELMRVMKPGGMGWLYLIENPGGLFWYSIEILREVMRGVDRETARRALSALGIPANRIFYMLDHVMVPINIRLTPEEVETCLASNGATSIRRLTRGADFDRIERIHQHEPYAAEKFGVGENRYIFSK
ncbi:MAG: methyltransferase domain-containing protein [Bryobacteraceae bacterium]|nr:methyltransferase domain-containing protein [Bryobacteraceae bacterium]